MAEPAADLKEDQSPERTRGQNSHATSPAEEAEEEYDDQEEDSDDDDEGPTLEERRSLLSLAAEHDRVDAVKGLLEDSEEYDMLLAGISHNGGALCFIIFHVG